MSSSIKIKIGVLTLYKDDLNHRKRPRLIEITSRDRPSLFDGPVGRDWLSAGRVGFSCQIFFSLHLYFFAICFALSFSLLFLLPLLIGSVVIEIRVHLVMQAGLLVTLDHYERLPLCFPSRETLSGASFPRRLTRPRTRTKRELIFVFFQPDSLLLLFIVLRYDQGIRLKKTNTKEQAKLYISINKTRKEGIRLKNTQHE